MRSVKAKSINYTGRGERERVFTKKERERETVSVLPIRGIKASFFFSSSQRRRDGGRERERERGRRRR